MNAGRMPAAACAYAFVDGALERAEHLREDPAARLALWPQARVLVLDDAGRAPADAQGRPLAVHGAQLAADPAQATWLGLDAQGQGWFLAEDAAPMALAAAQWIDLRRAAAAWPAAEATAFAQARALQHWHRRHRHCSVCGAGLRYLRAGWLAQCSACAAEHYPRTDQAVIVAVGAGDHLLLARQAAWPRRRWSVIAGFVEPGETLEQALAREVHEETGVRVRPGSPLYLGSQPWPFPGALMLGFLAEADSGPGAIAVGHELEDVRWVPRAEVEAALARDPDSADAPEEGIVLPAPLSIARHVITRWLQARTGASA